MKICSLFAEHNRIIRALKSACRLWRVKFTIFKFTRSLAWRLTVFETDKEVLDWYERQPRALTKQFVDSIPWRDVRNYELKSSFVPFLVYTRDGQYFTDIESRQL